MAEKKVSTKKKTASKKKTTKKAATKKVETKVVATELSDLDRKGLSARARQLKKELLAIRFNLQSPSLKDYRIKKKELAQVVSHLS